MALAEGILLGFPIGEQAAHVDLPQRPGVRGSADAADHVLRDLPAHGRDPNELVSPLRGRRGRSGAALPVGQEREDILTPDSTAGPGASDLRQLQAVLFEKLAHAGADPAFDWRWRRGDWSADRSYRFGFRCRCDAFDLELCKRGPYGNGLAGRYLDAHEPALDRRRHFCVHLVGDDLHDRLVPADELAFLLEPAIHGALGDGFTELRHLQCGQAHAQCTPGRF